MTKCTNCHSCLRIVRYDFDRGSRLYFYCPLCKKAFVQYNRVEEEDVEIVNAVAELYTKLYGKGIY